MSWFEEYREGRFTAGERRQHDDPDCHCHAITCADCRAVVSWCVSWHGGSFADEADLCFGCGCERERQRDEEVESRDEYVQALREVCSDDDGGECP